MTLRRIACSVGNRRALGFASACIIWGSGLPARMTDTNRKNSPKESVRGHEPRTVYICLSQMDGKETRNSVSAGRYPTATQTVANGGVQSRHYFRARSSVLR